MEQKEDTRPNKKLKIDLSKIPPPKIVPNITTEEESNRLFKFVLAGELTELKAFVSKNNSNIKAASELAPLLHIAIYGNDFPMVQYLLSAGANPLALESSGMAALFFALQGSPTMWLLRKAMIDQTFQAAKIAGNADRVTTQAAFFTIKTAIANGVDVNQQDKHGYTILHWATLRNNFPLVRYLVAEAKASVFLQSFASRHMPADKVSSDNTPLKHYLQEAMDRNKTVGFLVPSAWEPLPAPRVFFRCHK